MKKLIVLGLLAIILAGFCGSAMALIPPVGTLAPRIAVLKDGCKVRVSVARDPMLAQVSIWQSGRLVCPPTRVGRDGEVILGVPRGTGTPIEYRVICEWLYPFYVKTRTRTISVCDWMGGVRINF